MLYKIKHMAVILSIYYSLVFIAIQMIAENALVHKYSVCQKDITPNETRTRNQFFRRESLYPIEL